MSQWQPIESAPLAQWVLVWILPWNEAIIAERYEVMPNEADEWSGWIRDDGSDLFECNDDEGNYPTPTHWMPLPEPPKG